MKYEVAIALMIMHTHATRHDFVLTLATRHDFVLL